MTYTFRNIYIDKHKLYIQKVYLHIYEDIR